MFEPLPEFFYQLMDNYSNHSIGSEDFQQALQARPSKFQDVHCHNFGIDRATRVASSKIAAMQTSSLHVLEFLTHKVKDHSVHHDHAPRNEISHLVLKSVRNVFFDLFTSRYRFETDQYPAVDVLHLNCQGCEYNIIEGLHESGLLKHFGVIQILSLIAIEDSELDECILSEESGIDAALLAQKASEKFCRMEGLLRQTHEVQWGLPWFMQRWVTKGLTDKNVKYQKLVRY